MRVGAGIPTRGADSVEYTPLRFALIQSALRDVFASGTMDGGCCVELERGFKPGAVIEMEAAGIGVLRNRVVASPGG